MTTECVFCRIVDGEMPADMLYQDELVTVFRDIQPSAPTHLLIVPNQHLASLAEMGDSHGSVLGRIAAVANRMAAAEGIEGSGYRLITNVGPDGGQAVYHVHFHLLGGRPLGRLVQGRT